MGRDQEHPDNAIVDALMPAMRMTRLCDQVRQERDEARELCAVQLVALKKAVTERDELQVRLRFIGQVIIDEIGAPGPETAEVTACRAVALICKLKAEHVDAVTALAIAAAERDELRAQVERLNTGDL